LCGLLNEQPMGFYPPDSLVHEAQRRELSILPADVFASGVLCSVEAAGPRDGCLDVLTGRRSAVETPIATPRGSDGSPAVRLGLGYVLGVREEDVPRIVAEPERARAF